MIPIALLEHLQTVLQTAERIRGIERTLELHVVRSKAHRSHALFPWASDASHHKVHAHELLITATEQGVPIFGLETGVYTIPSSSIALVYVSKVDTTGLLDGPSPAAALTSAYLAHALAHPPAGCTSVRIHVFARAQDQYLFPESVKNAKKRRLSDKQLIRWWKRVFDQVAQTEGVPKMQRFYILPGFDHADSLVFVPRDEVWTYGHPYNALKSCMGGTSLADLIPAFPDDPKARFLISLTSSPIMPTGEGGDYDDAFESAAGHPAASAELLAGIALEQKRLKNTADEFWELMGARQECIDGHLTAFFVVASEEALSTGDSPLLPVLERTSYVRLWSELHNVDYSDLVVAKEKHALWRAGLEKACENDGADIKLMRGSVTLPAGTAKRPVEEAPAQPVVMKLQPRKKTKKA